MLYYNFDGYTGFQERFGIHEHGNGEKSRKNKILLAYIKNKNLLHQAVVKQDYSLINISSMSELKQSAMNMLIQSSLCSEGCRPYKLQLMDYTFYSSKYATDDYHGICEDGDTRAIRYINHENNAKVFKMKAGKLLRALMLETTFGQTLPEQVLVYLQEEFVAEWQTYAMQSLPETKLFVNDNFSRIYDGEELEGNFHSCMVDEGYHSFYSNAVSAKAAYLENDEGRIIARCVIYTDVHEDGSERIWRLAERQYSTECNDVLKRLLVDSLIRGGYIDGYKRVGAGCGDAREFVDVKGNSLADKKFWIPCSLGLDDSLSYQDSFKYYSYNKDRAYNYCSANYDYELDTTEGSIDASEGEYDEYHERYCSDITMVHYHGREMTCDSDDLDDFKWIERYDEYYFVDDCEFCADTDRWELTEDCIYSELLDAYYYDEDTMAEDEADYKKENWTYSEYDQAYFEDEEDVATIWKWNPDIQDYEETSIYVGTLLGLLKEKKLFVYEGEVYNQLRHGKPMHLAA